MKNVKTATQLVLVAGLPASGKTWLAGALAESLQAAHISSDAVRAEMDLRGAYDTVSKQKVYDAMLERGEAELKSGRNVIVDSTFYKKSLRQPWLELSIKCGVPCRIIKVYVPEDIAFQRLQKKREDSEATREVYLKLREAWEDIDENYLSLDSNRLSLTEMVKRTRAFLTENT